MAACIEFCLKVTKLVYFYYNSYIKEKFKSMLGAKKSVDYNFCNGGYTNISL